MKKILPDLALLLMGSLAYFMVMLVFYLTIKDEIIIIAGALFYVVGLLLVKQNKQRL